MSPEEAEEEDRGAETEGGRQRRYLTASELNGMMMLDDNNDSDCDHDDGDDDGDDGEGTDAPIWWETSRGPDAQ